MFTTQYISLHFFHSMVQHAYTECTCICYSVVIILSTTDYISDKYVYVLDICMCVYIYTYLYVCMYNYNQLNISIYIYASSNLSVYIQINHTFSVLSLNYNPFLWPKGKMTIAAVEPGYSEMCPGRQSGSRQPLGFGQYRSCRWVHLIQWSSIE